MAGSGSDTIIDSELMQFAPLIILLPMLAFPVILFLGRVFNRNPFWKDTMKEGGIIALVVMASSLIISLLLIKDHIGGFASMKDSVDFLWLNSSVYESGSLTSISFGFGIYIDHITVMLLFVASFLCLLINIFSIGYMNTDPINDNRNHRFYAEFVLFCAGMLGMVLADSFLWLFIFWEVMGLCSYLLIGFYYWKDSAAYASKKAFLTTRVGDVFLMIGLFILYDIYGSLEFSVIFHDPSLNGTVDSDKLFWALLMMFIGAVGKSAQFPLHVWLPDAMEGPTPVSALIHAATMVNAGLYLVARMVPFVDVGHHGVAGLEDLGLIVAYVGGITAFMAAAIAFVQNDIKKVLAYSTMSQLAYIFTGLGSALWFYNNDQHHAAVVVFGASMFHLFNHAMAKGMLFMASGSVIHEVHHAHDHIHHGKGDGHGHDFDPQDMRNMGGLASKMPVTATAMMFGSMSIIGIPLIGGFWSKEGIIAETWLAALEHEPLMYGPAILVLLTAGMTGFYMSRMWFMTFAGEPKSEVVEHIHEETQWIKMPLVVLTAITAFGGFAFALLGATDYLSSAYDYSGHLKLHKSTLLESILYKLEYAFLPEKINLRIVGWVTIFLSFIIGPVLAARIHGGKLADGESSTPFVSWLVSASSKFGKQDVSSLAESDLSIALQNRLYFDDLYEGVLARTVIPFSKFTAWFDRNVIDGLVKQIETRSVSGSVQVRGLTTGSARDYILMATVGMLSIITLLWGMNS